MTSEQIAELRKMLRTREKYGTDPWPRMWGLVPRLLDEREALLEAARDVLRRDGFEVSDDALLGLRAAIAKAESP